MCNRQSEASQKARRQRRARGPLRRLSVSGKDTTDVSQLVRARERDKTEDVDLGPQCCAFVDSRRSRQYVLPSAIWSRDTQTTMKLWEQSVIRTLSWVFVLVRPTVATYGCDRFLVAFLTVNCLGLCVLHYCKMEERQATPVGSISRPILRQI